MKLTELKTRDDIGLVLNEMGLNRYGVEVGVAFGENAEAILEKSNLSVLYLIDPWDYVPGENPKGFGDAIKDWEGCFDYCAKKLERFNGRFMMVKSDSLNASEAVASYELDFCYIDANHMSPHIDNDLAAWYDKVKPGGIFGGHDYHLVSREDYQCDVKSAVDNFFKDKKVSIHVTQDADPSWYIIKP